MERYHIYKLGFAILFYAIFYSRAKFIVSGLDIQGAIEKTNKTDPDDYFIYYQGVQGIPGEDFPVYSTIPRTSFSCKGLEAGYYADLDTSCQVFHICNDGRKISFLCPNGTIFQQSDLICEWWFKVNCTNSPNLYEESAEHLKEDMLRRKANRKVFDRDHGAIMRTEEKQSVSVSSQKNVNYEVHGQRTNQNRYETNQNVGEQQYSGGHQSLEGGSQQQNFRGNQRFESSTIKNGRYGGYRKESSSQAPQAYNQYQQTYNQNQQETERPPVTSNKQNSIAGNRNRQSNYKEVQNVKKQQSTSGGTLNRNDLINRRLEPTESEESQIPQETASFYKNNFNNIQYGNKANSENPYPNHRKTYTALKDPVQYTQAQYSTTTRASSTINNGQPFFGSTTSNYHERGLTTTVSTVAPIHKVLAQKYDSKLTPTVQSIAGELTPTVQTEGAFSLHPPTSSPELQKIKDDVKEKYGQKTPKPVFGARLRQKAADKNYYNQQSNGYTTTQVPYTQRSAGYNEVTTNTPETVYSTPQVDYNNYQYQNQYSAQSASNSFGSQQGYSNTGYTVSPAVESGHYSTLSANFPNTQPTFAPNYSGQGYNYEITPANEGIQFGAQAATSTIAPDTNGYSTTDTPNVATTDATLYNEQSSTTSAVQFDTSTVFSENRLSLFNTGAKESKNSKNLNFNFLQNVVTSPSSGIITTEQTTTEASIKNPTATTISTIDTITTTELFNSGKEYNSSFEVRVPTTVTPELAFVNKKPDSDILQGVSSARPFQFQGTVSPNYLPTANPTGRSISLNKLNFLANGLPSVSTPRVVIGIVHNNGKENDKPSGFYVTKKNEILQTTVPPSLTNKLGEGVSTLSRDVEPPLFVSNKNNVVQPKPFSYSSSTIPPEIFNVGRTSPSDFDTTTAVPSTTFASYQISSARPFGFSVSADGAISTVPTTLSTDKPSSVYENVDNMINALMEIANAQAGMGETPRPGLIVPPSVGPQTLHSLAVYFANALDNIAAGKLNNATSGEVTTYEPDEDEKILDNLLTHSTADKYKELFVKDRAKEEITTTTTATVTDEDNDLDTDNSKNPVQTTPRIRQLAQVFTHALSAYLDDPATFRRVLEEVRPTEPPALSTTENYAAAEEDEVLNFSDTDIKDRNRLAYPTVPSLLNASPTWGFILALNTSDVKDNSIGKDSNENLQSSDSQSFVSQFNNLSKDEKISLISTTILPPLVSDVKSFNDALEASVSTATATEIPLPKNENSSLPSDHWTDSPDATKLWQSTLFINPALVNDNLNLRLTTEISTSEDPVETTTVASSTIAVPTAEIQYELRSLPKIDLNSTQVHGILIDFMNKTDESSNKLQRILRKLNTTEEEFLSRMREIEANPLTRRLILLLISECGANATKEIEALAAPVQSVLEYTKDTPETLQTSSSKVRSSRQNNDERAKNSNYKEIVHPSLEEDDHDARALQLLNSLYTIASRWGK